MWVPSHNIMVCPQAAEGAEGLQVWRAINILNEQLWTTDKEIRVLRNIVQKKFGLSH